MSFYLSYSFINAIRYNWPSVVTLMLDHWDHFARLSVPDFSSNLFIPPGRPRTSVSCKKTDCEYIYNGVFH